MENSGRKILVVEDEADFLSQLADRLTGQGYEVLRADDGRKAVDFILQQKPDLILLDLLIPEIDGYQVLQTVRSHGDPKVSDTPVIVLSNLWSDKDILRAKALRISEYYVKAHTSLDQVFKTVSEVLAGRQA